MDNEAITGQRNNFEILSVWNYLQSLVHVRWTQRKVSFLKPIEKNKEFEIFHISQIMSNYPSGKKDLHSSTINYNMNNREIPNYLREHNTYFPHTTNAIESQSIYRAPMKLEGFAVRNRNYQVLLTILIFNKYFNYNCILQFQNVGRKIPSNLTFKQSSKTAEFDKKFSTHRELNDDKLNR